jgi:hypothetical protein
MVPLVCSLPDEFSPAAVCILEELEKLLDRVAVAIKSADKEVKAFTYINIKLQMRREWGVVDPDSF